MEIYFREYKTNELQYECVCLFMYVTTQHLKIYHPVLSDVPTNIIELVISL
jgi:hypothetical protein